jgi:hypothetical protein
MATTGINKKLQVYIAPVAGGADFVSPIGTVEEDCTIVTITYIPQATITGAATNNRTISVINKGQSGSGTAVPASLNFANGTNATAFDEKALTNSATAADLDAASGDVLAFSSVHVGTGIADPGGIAVVTYSPRTA